MRKRKGYFFSSEDSSDERRAVQAWQILVGMAMNRQTTTYLGLSMLMFGKPAPGVLAYILGHVAYYCKQEGYPQLNAIVVGKGRGTPGRGKPPALVSNDVEREKVYAYNWYNVWPPTKEELAQAWD